MRSLFAKILLWFLATAVIDFVGAVMISALDLNPWQSPFGRMMYVEEKAAQSAFETGGAAALSEYEQRFHAGSEMSAVLTDARGRDLLTGKVAPPPAARPFLAQIRQNFREANASK